MGSKAVPLDELNKTLATSAYVAGQEPSKADQEALKGVFGDDMKGLNWAARMATYSAAERKSFSAAAAAAAPKKAAPAAAAAAAPAPAAAPAKIELTKIECQREIGGAEGLVSGEDLATIPGREVEWSTNRVRQQFVDFFKEKGMPFYASSPSVPRDDPTLLFANAGMNQFKSVFLGTVDPKDELAAMKGAVNSQKCVRAGGKHNDLDDVGRDTYHHTFFEMLGCWSFGDYFKKEIIRWSFELMTEVYKLPADRLYATYFEGNEKLGLPADLEAKELWGLYLPADHILPGNMTDNFWEMGDIGPCGPCSEIHYDRVGGRNAAHLVNMDDPLVLELWNLVFMTHMRTEKGLNELPAKHVDTGMGLERVASALQGVYSNYDTDGWWKIFAHIQKLTGFPHAYHSKECPEDAVVAYRVVADHVRTITICLTDGGVPDNVGRGFVLRRIIRRAVRFGKEFLGAKVGFFSKLTEAVSNELGDFFPELRAKDNLAKVQAIVLDEEQAFDKTWETGVKHFQKAMVKARTAEQKKKHGGKLVVDGEDAFILHDRYGFPVDLTQIMAEKEKCDEPFVDMKGFDAKMSKQKEDSDKGSMKLKQFLSVNNIDILQKKGVASTVDAEKYVWENTTAKVVGLLDKQADELVQELGAGKPDPKDKKKKVPTEHMCVVLDKTNYYYEAGGQIFDTGVIAAKDGSFEVTVVQVQHMGGYVIHIGHVSKGVAKVGVEVDLKVDYVRRLNVGANHTGTHELNHCLRQVLQVAKKSHTEVNQKGSSVEPNCLRFDFSWNEKVPGEDVTAVEAMLNQSIDANKPVYDKVVPLKDASEINGVRMMFGEKYPDPVRVVCVGKPVEELLANPSNPEWQNYSVEFCGGTHIKSLSDMKKACIVGEEATMKGIRRMTVLTREPAQKAFDSYDTLSKKHQEIFNKPHTLAEIDEKMKAMSVHAKLVGETVLPIVKKIELTKLIDTQVKALFAEKKKGTQKLKDEAAALGETIGKSGEKIVVRAENQWGADREILNELIAAAQKANPAACCFVAASAKGKGLALCALPKGTGKSAKEWVQFACVKGGGTAERAQTGFDAADEAKVLAKAQEWAAANL